MRTGYSAENIVQLSMRHPSCGRRTLAPIDRGMTCLVLIRHGESKSGKAILVSDCGVHSRAVWVPKSMVVIEQPSERGILVASMAKAFAEQKRLSEKFIDPTLFNEATREVLAEANARAARKRNFYRGHRGQGPRIGQNAFC